MAGGVALNCVANGRIVREAGFENVWIQPAAGDDGIAIGCAYYGYLAILKKQRSSVMKHAYLGAPYSDEDAQRRRQLAGSSTNAKHAQGGHLPGYGKIAVGGTRVCLVPRPLRIRAARSRQPQHTG
jgi:predicted NodU family carbamoyl transferase